MVNIRSKNREYPPATEGILTVVDLFAFNQFFVDMVAHQEQENLDTMRSDRRYTVHHKIRLGQANNVTGEFVVQQSCWTQNVSISGVLFFAELQLEPSTTMALDLDPFGIPGHFVRIRILRCVQVLAHTYQVAACFLHDEVCS